MAETREVSNWLTKVGIIRRIACDGVTRRIGSVSGTNAGDRRRGHRSGHCGIGQRDQKCMLPVRPVDRQGAASGLDLVGLQLQCRVARFGVEHFRDIPRRRNSAPNHSPVVRSSWMDGGSPGWTATGGTKLRRVRSNVLSGLESACAAPITQKTGGNLTRSEIRTATRAWFADLRHDPSSC